MRVLLAAAGLVIAAAVGLHERPPALLRVGANYAAYIVCSNMFLAHRDPAEVLNTDVQAPGNPLLRLVRIRVDRRRGLVHAGMLGFIGHGLAVYRPGQGCTVVPDGRVAALLRASPSIPDPPDPAPPADQPWPRGEQVRTDPALDRLIAEPKLAGPGMRAIVVVDHGRIVAERYGRGFSADTPLIGWSMTKTVIAGLIGVLVEDGRLSLAAPAGLGSAADDPRSTIRVRDLLSMTSGLEFNENYGTVSDVTRMLYLEPDMAGYAGARPLVHPAGTVWSYSSGTAMILSRIYQRAAGPHPRAFARSHLFEPLGIESATLPSDESGTLVGASYMYATARDWARFGELLARQGAWDGRAILPPGYVAMMASPVAASDGEYGQGQVWRFGSDPPAPGVDPDDAYGIPRDKFWMEGHDGQYVAIIPSRDLVVVRMGLTPDRDHYLPQPLVHALLERLGT
ncbi:MAG: serine hydrolase [Gammaproteobacteria bacterium]|nr:serine hydrolase [Gammaproteobacteria bacterium]